MVLSLASAERFCDEVSLAMIASGAAAFFALSPLGGQVAQYGRHLAAAEAIMRSTSMPSSSTSTSPSSRITLPRSLPARWAWLTQELPALLLAPVTFLLTLRALESAEMEKSSRWRWSFFFSSPSASASESLDSLPLLLSKTPLPNKLLLLAFTLHYAWRSLFFPFLIRGGKETRALEWVLALVFCCWNGALQGSGAALVGKRRTKRERTTATTPSPSSSRLYLVLFSVSLCFWALFWGLNLAADAHLRSLRRRKKTTKKKSKTTTTTTATTTANGKEKEEKVETELELEDRGYKLPTSPLFALVACPNYAAECAEWLSFAAASLFASRAAAGEGSGRKSAVVLGEALPSLAFALFTAANLVPRALAHRRWYLEKFEDFPRGKKAIVPWVL